MSIIHLPSWTYARRDLPLPQIVRNDVENSDGLEIMRLTVELFGWSKAFYRFLSRQLAFLEHMHELNPGEGILGRVESLKSQYGTGDALHTAMILFHEIIQILVVHSM